MQSYYNEPTAVYFIRIIATITILCAAVAGAAEPPKVAGAPNVRGPWKTRINVRWSGTPLRESLDRLAAANPFPFLLDRRVDPSLTLVFEAKNEPLESALPRLAAEHGLGCHILTGTVYLGPEESAARLKRLLESRQSRLAGLPPVSRRFFRENVAVTSPMLGTPKEILATLARHGRMTWRNLDELPHDLWNETRLSGTAEELLTILLLGFDRTFDVDGTELVVVPLPEDVPVTAESRPAPVRTGNRMEAEKIPLARRRFTIRVEEQPLDELLRSLSERLGLTLKLDEKSLAGKNVAPDRRVSFEVENATAAELFRSILQPLRLQFRLRGDVIEVY